MSFDEAFTWDPGDPRLEELADAAVAFWGGESRESNWALDDPITVALMGSQPGNSSPAWDRLDILYRDRMSS